MVGDISQLVFKLHLNVAIMVFVNGHFLLVCRWFIFYFSDQYFFRLRLLLHYRNSSFAVLVVRQFNGFVFYHEFRSFNFIQLYSSAFDFAVDDDNYGDE